MIPIYDKRFRYTNSSATDLSKTFARERKRLADLKATEDAKSQKVRQLPKRGAQ